MLEVKEGRRGRAESIAISSVALGVSAIVAQQVIRFVNDYHLLAALIAYIAIHTLVWAMLLLGCVREWWHSRSTREDWDPSARAMRRW
jgi:hypothetical protein